MGHLIGSVAAERAEAAMRLPGDELLPGATVVMNRAFTVPRAPSEVWAWLAQLCKGRAGWSLPWAVERMIPRGRRAARAIDDRWQHLQVGDVVPDYGGKRETFEVRQI